MRDFSWKYFTLSGDVDAYLYFKQVARRHDMDWEWDEEEDSQAEDGTDHYELMN